MGRKENYPPTSYLPTSDGYNAAGFPLERLGNGDDDDLAPRIIASMSQWRGDKRAIGPGDLA